MILREYKNLTKTQVEALQECFDFLANGYAEYQFIQLRNVWIVGLYNQKNQNDMKVFIYENRFRIRKNFVTKKVIEREPSPDRYRLMVNSDASIGVVRMAQGGH